MRDARARTFLFSSLSSSWSNSFFPALLIGSFLAFPVLAQPPTPPAPTPDPVFANVFYGAVNPAFNFKTPVLVFVPGLGGVACDWFSTGSTGSAPCVNNGVTSPANDMYAYAYQAGYRTAFISPNTDNSPANGSIGADAANIAAVIPRIAAFYNTQKIYFVGHSKGGLDLQQAILNPAIYPLVKGVFNLSTPNQGDALADWAFAHPGATQSLETQLLNLYGLNLNFLSAGVFSLETANMAAFRAAVDPKFKASLAKPFYTWGGTGFYDSAVTLVMGGLLTTLIPVTDLNTENDGLVTVAESQLSPEFSNDLGFVVKDHFKMNQGNVSFPKIDGRIQGIESTTDEFQKIAVNGFARFGGNPYSTMIWSAKWFNNKLYVGTGSSETCLTYLTSDVRTGTKSYPSAQKADLCPDPVTLAQNLAAEIWEWTPTTNTWRLAYRSPQNVPVTVNNVQVNTALDIGYRGMTLFQEADGTVALYVGTSTSGSAFQPAPFQPNGYPPPRILRTTDGVNWTQVPEDPGTFLANLANYFLNPTTLVRSFRSLTPYKGMLFATVGDYNGAGIVIASATPAAGDNTWKQVSPSWSAFPTWDLKVFNNLLYATTGFTKVQNPNGTGYGVYYTAATGTAPYQWTPVVINGGNQTNSTYLSPNGLALFVFRNELYLGTDRPTELIRIRPDNTWDLIVGASRTYTDPVSGQPVTKAPLSGMGNGFDNGFTEHFWRLASITGPSADQNSSGQNLFLGTFDWSVSGQEFGFAGSIDAQYTYQYGTDVYRSEDGVHFSPVTQNGFGDPNAAGTRTLEATPYGLVLGTARQKYGADVFIRTRASSNPLAAPRRLRAESIQTAGLTANLSWDPSPNAVMFNVYRATVPANGITLGTSSIPGSYPLEYQLIAQTTGSTFSETAPSTVHSLYYVRAVDANGNLSDVSNIVGAPSYSAPIPDTLCDIDGDGFVDMNDIALINESIGTPVFGVNDPRDANHDGAIDATDASFCTAKCNNTGCALQ